ncbi:MAG: hypothetical protein ACLQU3_13750 [Limisphaerales bacterium]
MNFWRRGVGWEWIFVIARSLELQALPYALNRPPRAAASFDFSVERMAAGGTRLEIRVPGRYIEVVQIITTPPKSNAYEIWAV